MGTRFDESRLAQEKLLRAAAAEHGQRKRHVRTLVILAVSIAAALGALLYGLKEVAQSQQAGQAVVDPSRLPPIRPGPR